MRDGPPGRAVPVKPLAAAPWPQSGQGLTGRAPRLHSSTSPAGPVPMLEALSDKTRDAIGPRLWVQMIRQSHGCALELQSVEACRPTLFISAHREGESVPNVREVPGHPLRPLGENALWTLGGRPKSLATHSTPYATTVWGQRVAASILRARFRAEKRGSVPSPSEAGDTVAGPCPTRVCGTATPCPVGSDTVIRLTVTSKTGSTTPCFISAHREGESVSRMPEMHLASHSMPWAT